MRCLKNKLSSGAFQEHLSVIFLSFGGLDEFAERGADILDAAMGCGGSYGNGWRIVEHEERRQAQFAVFNT